MLKSAACGFGHLALLGLLGNEARADPGSRVQPLALKKPHFAPRAKNVIFLFMHGGVSHIDTFDPKPELDKMHGKDLPFELPLQFAGDIGKLLKSPWSFRQYGQSGLPVSELFPHVGSVIDEICLLRSLHSEQVDHGGAILQLHTGSAVFPRPSMGAWLVYGLGNENRNLPGFVTICPPVMHGGTQNYGAA
ncbi:MAG TPA: DUF1501 domain-containing protein, partial [Gammaproteobacteria bacterium]|nr:DUF1501 domain-containing protein [Gammaproteobacteria bacterium]